jgi:hypothetical protein
MQARLSAAPDLLLDLHDAVLALPDFYIERGAGLDFLVWDEETAARPGHRVEVCPANGTSIVKVERRGGRGPGREDLPALGRSSPPNGPLNGHDRPPQRPVWRPPFRA